VRRRVGATAIVLAGGRASRFGGGKLAAQLDGMTLLDRAIAAVAAVAEDILVAGPVRSDWRRLPGVSIRNVVDAEAFAGPLAALAGALGAAQGTRAIVVGGDMPRLVPAVLAAMLEVLELDPGLDAVTLAPNGPGEGDPPRPQVLPLAVRVESVARAAGKAVIGGDRSLVRLLDRLRWIEIPAAEWLVLDPNGQTVLDIDVPADLERARDQRFF
jgi:molybdopterin-guanine dinucleotide biosynthesis protein A